METCRTRLHRFSEQFGRVDIVIANAGIIRMGPESEDFLADWNDVIDTNLTGVYHTVRASLPALPGRDAGPPRPPPGAPPSPPPPPPPGPPSTVGKLLEKKRRRSG